MLIAVLGPRGGGGGGACVVLCWLHRSEFQNPTPLIWSAEHLLCFGSRPQPLCWILLLGHIVDARFMSSDRADVAGTTEIFDSLIF
jgi:hypothetical protein